jgi:xanthine/CO dehydrogenase XdhC/CoxF family maturation factor
VLTSGTAELVRYDMRGPDDLLFGLGSGCEGDMEILLQRIDAATGWQPLRRLADAWKARRPQRLVLVVRSTARAVADADAAVDTLPAGCGLFPDDGAPFGNLNAAGAEALRHFADALAAGKRNQFLPQALPGTDLLLVDQAAPPRLLLLGAGPDALPVAQLVAFLGWSLIVVDHRSHYARPARFEHADAVLDGGARSLAEHLQGQRDAAIDAAIIMSHHLLTDLAYLRVLATSDIPYVGLLGPASRRDRLLEELGAPTAARLRPRLRAPVGLDLGAASPEAIALSIVAEIHAIVAGNASMIPLSDKANCAAPLGMPAVGERA